MKKAGTGVPKMTRNPIINGSKPQNKGGAFMKVGTNKASGAAATKVSKVK